MCTCKGEPRARSRACPSSPIWLSDPTSWPLFPPSPAAGVIGHLQLRDNNKGAYAPSGYLSIAMENFIADPRKAFDDFQSITLHFHRFLPSILFAVYYFQGIVLISMKPHNATVLSKLETQGSNRKASPNARLPLEAKGGLQSSALISRVKSHASCLISPIKPQT